MWMQDDSSKDQLNEFPIAFYSGFTMVYNPKYKIKVKVSAHGELGAFAKAQKCNTIDDIVRFSGQSKGSVDWTPADWAAVSEVLAEEVKGVAKVLLGKTVDIPSVWIAQERPALMANKGIDTVTVWEIQENGEHKQMGNIKGNKLVGDAFH